MLLRDVNQQVSERMTKVLQDKIGLVVYDKHDLRRQQDLTKELDVLFLLKELVLRLPEDLDVFFTQQACKGLKHICREQNHG